MLNLQLGNILQYLLKCEAHWNVSYESFLPRTIIYLFYIITFIGLVNIELRLSEAGLKPRSWWLSGKAPTSQSPCVQTNGFCNKVLFAFPTYACFRWFLLQQANKKILKINWLNIQEEKGKGEEERMKQLEEDLLENVIGRIWEVDMAANWQSSGCSTEAPLVIKRSLLQIPSYC